MRRDWVSTRDETREVVMRVSDATDVAKCGCRTDGKYVFHTRSCRRFQLVDAGFRCGFRSGFVAGLILGPAVILLAQRVWAWLLM